LERRLPHQAEAGTARHGSRVAELEPRAVARSLEAGARFARGSALLVPSPPLGSRAGRRRPAEVPRPEDRLVLTPAFDDAARLRLLLAPRQAFTLVLRRPGPRGSDARGCQRRPLAGRRCG